MALALGEGAFRFENPEELWRASYNMDTPELQEWMHELAVDMIDILSLPVTTERPTPVKSDPFKPAPVKLEAPEAVAQAFVDKYAYENRPPDQDIPF